ncbi:hypothetical protein DAEQUDRAFT_729859 [Daedalea quercina L-15889]|uniref:Uncharacterized protein n=1 Tax=Daedalea quercina L-15889 TaxID=1314783 RepID=A0A165NB14_9APHY|nr:hypothetical protein DAEQUDRAFT_729859 [Daedalea quercina L-15889]
MALSGQRGARALALATPERATQQSLFFFLLPASASCDRALRGPRPWQDTQAGRQAGTPGRPGSRALTSSARGDAGRDPRSLVRHHYHASDTDDLAHPHPHPHPQA